MKTSFGIYENSTLFQANYFKYPCIPDVITRHLICIPHVHSYCENGYFCIEKAFTDGKTNLGTSI